MPIKVSVTITDQKGEVINVNETRGHSLIPNGVYTAVVENLGVDFYTGNSGQEFMKIRPVVRLLADDGTTFGMLKFQDWTIGAVNASHELIPYRNDTILWGGTAGALYPLSSLGLARTDSTGVTHLDIPDEKRDLFAVCKVRVATKEYTRNDGTKGSANHIVGWYKLSETEREDYHFENGITFVSEDACTAWVYEGDETGDWS